jgi:carboxylate-amine ligase
MTEVTTPLPTAFADHSFGSSPAFTLGVEEELLLVDEDGHRLSHHAAEVLARMQVPPGRAGHEAFAAEIELRTEPGPTAGHARTDLAGLRAAARDAGATLMGCGLHPTAAFGEAPLVDSDRYRKVAATMRGLIRRTPDCALHVHVSMPDPDTAVRVLNGLREHLPLLVALSANSPLWFGHDSGMASARYAHVRGYPRRGVPRPFNGYEAYARTVQDTLDAGDLNDYTLVWWDVRLQPRLGTIEIREMDSQSRLDDVAALAALVQALARHEAQSRQLASTPSEPLSELTFLAARDGLDATLPSGGRRVPMRELAERTLDLALPHARELGSETALDGVRRILAGGSGAERQRVALAQRGDQAVLDLLVRDTARA